MGPAVLAVVAWMAASSVDATPSMPPDAVRELAEIAARDAEHHDPENLYAMAVLREHLGHWMEATALYRDYVRETADGGAHAPEANEAIDRIEHTAGFIKVRADVGFDRRVWLDGRAQLATPPVTLIVPAGTHEVDGSGSAGTIQRVVDVKARQLVEVWIGPGDAPYPPARPVACIACGFAIGARLDGDGWASTRANVGVGLGIAVLALARRRRPK